MASAASFGRSALMRLAAVPGCCVDAQCRFIRKCRRVIRVAEYVERPDAVSSSGGRRKSFTTYSSEAPRISSACAARKSTSFWRRSASPSARISTASRAALVAPALPMARVATGNSARHLGHGQQRVQAVQRPGLHRHAQHREQCVCRHHPSQVRRAAGGGDQYAHSARLGRARPIRRLVRRAVRGEHPNLVGHAEVTQGGGGPLHHVPIGGAAHHDANARSLVGIRHGRLTRPGPANSPARRQTCTDSRS